MFNQIDRKELDIQKKCFSHLRMNCSDASIMVKPCPSSEMTAYG